MSGDGGPEMGSDDNAAGRLFTAGKEKERKGLGESNGSEGYGLNPKHHQYPTTTDMVLICVAKG